MGGGGSGWDYFNSSMLMFDLQFVVLVSASRCKHCVSVGWLVKCLLSIVPLEDSG